MIKLIVFDFDGVFTDGKFYFDNDENLKKAYNCKDSYALTLINKSNIKCGIITNDKFVSIKNAPHIFNRLDKFSLGCDEPKIDILDKWITEYQLTYNEVAYIGDDLPDIEILKKVGFSACPNDAVEEVKEICCYICKKNGGDGAVREFVDLIIKNNNKQIETKFITNQINNDGKITAVIPVKKDSQRCKNKNIRRFEETNLLKLKIETLKKVKGIDKILVSSNCDKMLEIAKELGVDTYKRDERYCTNENIGGFYCDLTNTIHTQFLMHTPVTTPLITHVQYEEIITKWNENKMNYDSLNTSTKINEFIWYNEEPVNYDRKNPISSQYLPDYKYLNFGCNIISKESLIDSNNIIGKKPLFFDINPISGIDIDTPLDFIKAELFYKHNILNDNICKLILEKKTDNIELLDCTIRDGGYLNNWNFSDEEVLDCYKAVSDAGYNYFEIGFRTKKNHIPNAGKWCYCTEDDINKIYQTYKGCNIAVMAKVGTFTIDDFVVKSKSNISLVRVLLARTTIENGIQKSKYNKKDIQVAKMVCEQLLDYGYEVCINFGCGDIIDDDEIQIIASEFHNVKLKSLYLADTYGGFNDINLPIQLHKFYMEFQKYNSNISFGFHCHNNNEDALCKTLIAMDHGCTMIDSCINGLGRGAGNLKSEQLISYIYRNSSEYITKITPLILYYDKHMLSKKAYNENNYIQSHPYYMISSVLSLHPDYIVDILTNLNSRVKEDIELILKLDKYTKENNERNYSYKLFTNLSKEIHSI
jgi:YrbI family 3-deoxy-D-manno-octulosonate 8-phosphate phosphatase